MFLSNVVLCNITQIFDEELNIAVAVALYLKGTYAGLL